ncbi:MAG: winged helix-turn-helix domain-containing protein [Pseudomonadota bacterium]
MHYTFGEFLLDLDRFELRRGDALVPMERRNFDMLVHLVENRTRTVSKEDLIAAVWQDVVVTDASLSTALAQIRKALGDSGQTQALIRTIRGRGFRFVAEVGIVHDRAAKARSQDATESEHNTRPSIAVLPFELFGDDAAANAIAEAIPAELIATLARLRWLKVIARGSTFKFSPNETDFDEILSGLGATYAMTGSVEITGSSLSILVELTDTRTQHVVWVESFRGGRDAVFEMREQIARKTVSALEVHVPLNEAERLTHTPSGSLDAWGHYHLGVRHMQSYDRTKNLIAEGHLKKAVAIDPKFARAEAALAYTEFHNHFQMFGSETGIHRDLSMKHAEQAIELDPLDPFCALNYGRAKWLFGDIEEGLGWIERALTLNPNYAFGFYNSGIFQNILCKADMADEHVGNALDLSPLDPHLQSMLGTRALAAFLKDDLISATGFADQSLRAPNPHLYVYTLAAVVFHSAGLPDKARRCVQKIRARQVPFSGRDFLFHYDLRDTDRKRQMERALTALGI